MTSTYIHFNPHVSQFLEEQNHPFDETIQALRAIILGTKMNLEEDIKWNGPNYTHNGNDRISMRIQPPKKIQLIFHRGAKKLQQPANHLISEDFNLLDWRENDRAIATFNSAQEVETARTNLQELVKNWILAAK